MKPLEFRLYFESVSFPFSLCSKYCNFSVMDIVAQIGTPIDPVANDEKIFNTGRIPYGVFKVAMPIKTFCTGS